MIQQTSSGLVHYNI